MSFKLKFANNYLKFKLDRALENKAMYVELAEFMRTRIYQNTKRGYYGGIKKNLAKFKPLSDGYIESRREALKGKVKENKKGLLGRKRSAKAARKKAIKNFGEFFAPPRSNLTFTGDLLNALDVDFDAKNRTIRAYVEASPRSDGSGLSNLEVAKLVNERGRPFPTIDVKGVNQMVRKIIASLRRSLRGSKR